jgi:hypothetical protein
MKNTMLALSALLLIASFLTSCATAPSTTTNEEVKKDRTKSSMYAR